jgi:hypothetical protein
MLGTLSIVLLTRQGLPEQKEQNDPATAPDTDREGGWKN